MTADRRRAAAGVVAIALALAGAACAPGGREALPAGVSATSAAPAAKPAPVKPLAEARIDNPRLRVRLIEVKRVGPEVLAVTLLLSNPDLSAAVVPGPAFAAAPADAGSIADVTLIDEARSKKYFVMRDDQGRAACSQGIEAIPPGEELSVWARFPGPPAGIKRISVQISRLATFRDVPIS